jgi:hypothetical protein
MAISPQAKHKPAGLRKTSVYYDYLYNIKHLLINFLASPWSYPSLRL